MYKLYFIAKNNMKKQRGDMMTFFILTFIVAVLLFDCGSALVGMGHVMDDKFQEINGAHIMLFNYGSEAEDNAAEKVFSENEHIQDWEKSSAAWYNGNYRNQKDAEYQEYPFILAGFDTERKYADVEIPDKDLKENEILVPLFLKGSFAEGDVLEFDTGSNIYEFTVAGYVEDPYFCSAINLTYYYVYLQQQMIDRMIRENPGAVKEGYVFKGVVDEMFLSDHTTMDLEKEITDAYKAALVPYSAENPEADYTQYLVVNWQMMRGGAQFVPMIVMGIVAVFAVLILGIALIIISFSIKNFIRRNMKNTGILEAGGYTVTELRAALMVQMLQTAFLGTVLGVTTGLLTFHGFGSIVSAVLGLTWNQPANVAMAVLTVCVIMLIIFLGTLRTSRLYKKISVLDSLRGGIHTHNFRKNHFPFEKTPLPVSIVMALKDTFGNPGRNLALVFISAILTISTLIGFGMMQNFGSKPEGLIHMMGFEMGTATVTGENDIADELREVEGVGNVLTMTGFEPTIRFNGKEQSNYLYAVDDMEYTTNTVILEGRIAKHDNEVMLTGALADDLGAGVGDIVEISFADKTENYLVSGLNQRMERMGRTIYMTLDGASKILPGHISHAYAVTAKDGYSYEDIEKNIQKYADEKGIRLECNNDEKMMQGTIGTLSSAMKALCLVISVITILIVVFVESLVIRAKIVREWGQMGISKALGMTSAGLIAQIALSNIPAILAGTVIGAMLSQFAGRQMCMGIFSLFGIRQVDFDISFVWMVVSAVGILSVAVITSGLQGIRVKKLNPVDMITDM